MHSGVGEAAFVTHNKALGRTQYSGEFLALAKAVEGAAQGGQVLMTDSAFGKARIHG